MKCKGPHKNAYVHWTKIAFIELKYILSYFVFACMLGVIDWFIQHTMASVTWAEYCQQLILC